MIEQGGGMMGPVLIMMMVIFVFAIVFLYFYLAVWMYRDASRRGMDATVWLLIFLVVGPVGLIIYLIVRKDSPPQTRIASNDQPVRLQVVSTVNRTEKFCNQCGMRLAIDAKFCSGCGMKQL